MTHLHFRDINGRKTSAEEGHSAGDVPSSMRQAGKDLAGLFELRSNEA